MPLKEDKLFDSEKHVRDLKAENAAKVKAKAAEMVAKKKSEDKKKKPEMSQLAGKHPGRSSCLLEFSCHIHVALVTSTSLSASVTKALRCDRQVQEGDRASESSRGT